jgi:hypothetical protein
MSSKPRAADEAPDADFQNPKPALASSNAQQNLKSAATDLTGRAAALKFEREDWTAFRTIEGLCQKAGVTKPKLARLVLKELADNALDTDADVQTGELPKGGYFVEDAGPGIDPAEVARLFSISRPLVSSKLLRLPTRGALGNGLRVVAGAVLASEGSLTVITRNRCLRLRPERDGTTTVVSDKAVKFPVGTRIEIVFGPALQGDANPLYWAGYAVQLALHGQRYAGKTSPWWYDVPQFLELLDATGETPVRKLVSELDGCSGDKAGEIVATAGLNRTTCRGLTRPQAEKLLLAARANAREVTPKRLGAVGADGVWSGFYAVAYGTATFGSAEPRAQIPYVVEAWARTANATGAIICVNRTPVAGAIRAARDKRDIDLHGCNLHHTVAKAPEAAQFDLCVNITTPYMPITSDGKEPDLRPFVKEIGNVIAKAVRQARRPGGNKVSQKDVVLENLDDVIAEVSGGYRFNARQLFYALRPIVMAELGAELQYGNFISIITDYESDNGEIAVMYREPRGSITHPHRDETITLGTLMVEGYERPEWTFNKLLYIEKEGANEALKEVRWPEQHDCAVMSSKGYSTRAARDLIDKLAEHDEPIEVFCVHDADAAGGVIYETLQEATKARDARKIQIINLGLEPWETISMDLEVETVKAGDRRKPVADYIKARTDMAPDGDDWDSWLQTHRVELNAMTTPQFIAWLNGKMNTHAVGKLVPPAKVLTAELNQRVEQKVRATLTERILREAGLDRQVEATVAAIKQPSAEALAKGIRRSFKQRGDSAWRDHVEAEAAKLTRRA